MYLLKRESLTGFNLKLKDQWGQYYQMYFNAGAERFSPKGRTCQTAFIYELAASPMRSS